MYTPGPGWLSKVRYTTVPAGAGAPPIVSSPKTEFGGNGGAPTAADGVDRLRALVRQAAGRIVILAGGSVRAHNAAALVRSSGVAEIHSRTPADAAEVRALVLAANGA